MLAVASQARPYANDAASRRCSRGRHETTREGAETAEFIVTVREEYRGKRRIIEAAWWRAEGNGPSHATGPRTSSRSFCPFNRATRLQDVIPRSYLRPVVVHLDLWFTGPERVGRFRTISSSLRPAVRVRLSNLQFDPGLLASVTATFSLISNRVSFTRHSQFCLSHRVSLSLSLLRAIRYKSARLIPKPNPEELRRVEQQVGITES